MVVTCGIPASVYCYMLMIFYFWLPRSSVSSFYSCFWTCVKRRVCALSSRRPLLWSAVIRGGLRRFWTRCRRCTISTQFYKRAKVLNLISNFDPSRPVSSSFPNETAHLNLILCEFHESICIHYDEVSLNVWEESAYQKGQKQMYPLCSVSALPRLVHPFTKFKQNRTIRIIIIIHKFHRDASLETKLQGRSWVIEIYPFSMWPPYAILHL